MAIITFMLPARNNFGEMYYSAKSNYAEKYLAQFVFSNMPPEAEAAIDNFVILPTVHEFLRLAGIEIDGQEPLTIDELIGPKTLSELPRNMQAFYFSGFHHPVLEQARRSKNYITFQHLQNVGSYLGVSKSLVTKNYKALLQAVFYDELTLTYGQPVRFEGRNITGHDYLDLFAVRKSFAKQCIDGEYVTHNGRRLIQGFTSIGSSLLKEIMEPRERILRLNLTHQLEELDEVAVAYDNINVFDWNAVYETNDGTKLSMSQVVTIHLKKLIDELFDEIGIKPSSRNETWSFTKQPTNEAFILIVNALCALDKDHSTALKRGAMCNMGIHARGLTPRVVKHAKIIAEIINSKSTCMTTDKTEDHQDNVINLDDPGFKEEIKIKPHQIVHNHDW